MSNNAITLDCTVERSFNSGLYIAKVDGKIVGDFATKFFAKRAIKKYIKNNFSDKALVWREIVTIAD